MDGSGHEESDNKMKSTHLLLMLLLFGAISGGEDDTVSSTP